MSYENKSTKRQPINKKGCFIKINPLSLYHIISYLFTTSNPLEIMSLKSALSTRAYAYLSSTYYKEFYYEFDSEAIDFAAEKTNEKFGVEILEVNTEIGDNFGKYFVFSFPENIAENVKQFWEDKYHEKFVELIEDAAKSEFYIQGDENEPVLYS